MLAEIHFALPVESKKDIVILPSRPTAELLKNEGIRAISDVGRLRKAVEFLHASRSLFKVATTEFFEAATGVRVVRMASYSGLGAESDFVGVEYSVEVDGDSYSLAMVESQDLANAVARVETVRIFRKVEAELNSNRVTTPRPRF
ncbi:hypothetical protein NC00_13430 [Xanthomonas cannabis pv. phaseoli]|uniref:Uncharacterized protein n=1 Tax=Xanthomonas cannabis pv. phaseoli TaxID=1885902 RepID=A0AB34P6S8_9XANT|nr:hypothetical protein NC00_13430 [Xanthomonas cannabis pv. phaseoli]